MPMNPQMGAAAMAGGAPPQAGGQPPVTTAAQGSTMTTQITEILNQLKKILPQVVDQNGYVDDKFGWDFINNDGDPMDDNSHGTHCAGIAAAETDNELGMAGVSPGARIMGVKVLQSGGYGTASQVAQGILYAANNGATVINMSLGSPAASMVEAPSWINRLPLTASGDCE